MAFDEIDVDVVDVDVDDDAAEVVAEHGPFKLLATGMVATGTPTFEEWEAALGWAQKVEKASPFWVGDLLAYGEAHYGETYAQALDSTAYAYGTLANIAYVCREVESSRRREHLSFSHHQEVAPLPPAEQIAWLDKAEAEGLTVPQLRIHLKAHKGETTGHPVELWVMVRCTDVADQSDFASRMQLEGRAVILKAKET